MVRLVGFIIVSFFSILGYELNLIFKIKKLDYSSVEKVIEELIIIHKIIICFEITANIP